VNPDPAQSETTIYTFNGFRVDTAKRLVYDEGGEPLPLKAKAFETLLYLIENSGRVIERDELLSSLWPDTIVEENNLTQHISALRRLLGEKPDEHRYIATIPGRGYKFVAEVSKQSNDIDDGSAIRVEHAAATDLRPGFGRPMLLAGSIFVLVLLGSSYFYWSGGTNKEVPQSIAVLPFKPLVAGKSDESLEIGMADTLISKLGDIDGLVVRPLTSVRRFSSVDQDSIEAGRALGVDAVLDGKRRVFVREDALDDDFHFGQIAQPLHEVPRHAG